MPLIHLREKNKESYQLQESKYFPNEIWMHSDSESSNIMTSFQIVQEIQRGLNTISIEVYGRIYTSIKNIDPMFYPVFLFILLNVTHCLWKFISTVNQFKICLWLVWWHTVWSQTMFIWMVDSCNSTIIIFKLLFSDVVSDIGNWKGILYHFSHIIHIVLFPRGAYWFLCQCICWRSRPCPVRWWGLMV